MKLNPTHIKQINDEVIDRLNDFIKQIEEHGVNGIGIDFKPIEHEDLLSEATDALANGDLLRCIVYDTLDHMDTFYEDK